MNKDATAWTGVDKSAGYSVGNLVHVSRTEGFLVGSDAERRKGPVTGALLTTGNMGILGTAEWRGGAK